MFALMRVSSHGGIDVEERALEFLFLMAMRNAAVMGVRMGMVVNMAVNMVFVVRVAMRGVGAGWKKSARMRGRRLTAPLAAISRQLRQ